MNLEKMLEYQKIDHEIYKSSSNFKKAGRWRGLKT